MSHWPDSRHGAAATGDSGQPDEVAPCTVLLAREHAFSGQVLRPDGTVVGP
jgi:hypothetical protein